MEPISHLKTETVLRVSRKKIPKFFPVANFFRMLQIKCLSKWPYFQKPPLP